MMSYVTGANGFIGSHLVKKLSDPIPVDHDNLEGNFYLPDSNCFFLSTYGNMAHHKHYGGMVNANVTGMLSIIREYKGWFCYMSSSSVTLPVQTPYSRTKRAAEEILRALPELKSCIVRPYSVTGVGEQKEHLIPTIIRSCMEGEEVTFVPWPMHDFIDVEDVVDGLIRLADAQATGMHEFGSGLQLPNQTILEMVEEITGRKANVIRVKNLRDYDGCEWFCKHRSPFFKYQKTIANSIEEMVEAYKNEHA